MATIIGEISGTIQALQSETVILTDAQIKALPSTYIDVVPALGADKVALAIFSTLKWHCVAGYTNAPAGTAWVGLSYNGLITVSDASILSNIPEVAVDGFATLPAMIVRIGAGSEIDYGNYFYQDISGYSNKPIQIGGITPLGNFTGGNAANTLEVTVYYIPVDL